MEEELKFTETDIPISIFIITQEDIEKMEICLGK
jgi:hypothetical protein